METATDFLEPTLRALLPDPSRLLAMDAAAERLADAVMGADDENEGENGEEEEEGEGDEEEQEDEDAVEENSVSVETLISDGLGS